VLFLIVMLSVMGAHLILSTDDVADSKGSLQTSSGVLSDGTQYYNKDMSLSIITDGVCCYAESGFVEF
jgi:hypothetical protein